MWFIKKDDKLQSGNINTAILFFNRNLYDVYITPVSKLCTKLPLDVFVLLYLVKYKGVAMAVIRKLCTAQTYVSGYQSCS
jgi:hypothetical protein